MIHKLWCRHLVGADGRDISWKSHPRQPVSACKEFALDSLILTSNTQLARGTVTFQTQFLILLSLLPGNPQARSNTPHLSGCCLSRLSWESSGVLAGRCLASSIAMARLPGKQARTSIAPILGFGNTNEAGTQPNTSFGRRTWIVLQRQGGKFHKPSQPPLPASYFHPILSQPSPNFSRWPKKVVLNKCVFPRISWNYLHTPAHAPLVCGFGESGTTGAGPPFGTRSKIPRA